MNRGVGDNRIPLCRKDSIKIPCIVVNKAADRVQMKIPSVRNVVAK